MYTGPHLIKDNLVFGYDTGYGVADNNTATRFYPGEATTNFVTTNLETLGTDGSGQSSIGTRTTIAPNHVRIVDVASNTRQSHLISGLTASTIYTVSIQFKKITGTPTFRFQLQGYSGSSYVNTIKFTSTAETGLEDIEGWQTAEWTFTLPSNCNALRIWWQDGADYTTYTHSFELKNPQLEAKSHVTPYVSGTRSSTASLIDLKKTTNIDVSNVSFDSTGQPTFDGTDDYIYPNNITNGSGLTSITAEFVVKASANNKNIIKSNSNAILLHYGGAGFYLNSTDSTTSGYLGWNNKLSGGTGVYEHLVATYDGTTMKLYVNGESTGTTRAYSAGSTGILKDLNGVTIGGNFNSSQPYFNGDIPIAKIHNRALTAGEVKQNYNAYKNRFDI